ncbi:MAG: Wzz/FepE/Etk N-terminal domain-containing protein [Bacteroidia bacterium]|nr:Wzz/FepE/Etk N-terminal domain-containing protein [Bacteroidia bacterium]
MSQAPTENPFSLMFIFEVIRKYLLYIIGVVVFACIIAFICTLPFIYPPEYRSSTIIYPNSAERFDLENLFHKEPDMFVYGGSKEAEKLVNIADNVKLKLEVIDSLDLWPVYGVDEENDASPHHYALLNYDSYISVSRVAGDGVRIEAFDIDPDRAAAIVNLLAYKIDQYNRNMMNRNKAGILDMYQEGETEMEGRIALLSDSVRKVRKKYNIFRSLTQTERMVEAALAAEGDYAQAMGEFKAGSRKRSRAEIAGLRNRVEALTTDSAGSSINLERFREGMDRVIAIEEQIETLSEELAYTRRKTEYLRMMARNDYSTIMMPDPAIPADRKSRPVRWIILVATFLISALVSILGAVLIDKITEITEGSKTEDKSEPAKETDSPKKA